MPMTTTNLFRKGNAGGPRMANVRIGKDIVVFQINGIEWVAAHSGGVSTFSVQGFGANWRLLPAGFDDPDELLVVNDHGNHYNWEPSVDLPLAEFVTFLESVEPAFQKVS
jgi:hypothetical protein